MGVMRRVIVMGSHFVWDPMMTAVYRRGTPYNPFFWHEWFALWPMRSVHRRRVIGKVWRRRNEFGMWQYERRR
jgi:hypothetical protein